MLPNIAVALSNIFLVNKSQASWIILSCRTFVSSIYYSYTIVHWIKGFKPTNLINWWTALQLICVQRQFWTSAEVTLRRSEIFQHLVLKPITLFAQNGRSRFQQLEELKDWITDRPFLHWLWIYMVLHDHFKFQLVMHRSILIKTSCSNISILNAASKQSRIKLHQNGCFSSGPSNLLHHLFWLPGFYPTEGIIKVISWRTGQAPHQ